MPRKRTIHINWHSIRWKPGDLWSDVLQQLNKQGIHESDLPKCVYVIKAYSYFAIEYPLRISPTIYIGQGNLHQRLYSHKKWLEDIIELIDISSFKILVAFLKIPTDPKAHRDFEAELLLKFKNTCGCLPLANRLTEKRRIQYNYTPPYEINKYFTLGRGEHYYWSVKPLPLNDYYKQHFS